MAKCVSWLRMGTVRISADGTNGCQASIKFITHQSYQCFFSLARYVRLTYTEPGVWNIHDYREVCAASYYVSFAQARWIYSFVWLRLVGRIFCARKSGARYLRGIYERIIRGSQMGSPRICIYLINSGRVGINNNAVSCVLHAPSRGGINWKLYILVEIFNLKKNHHRLCWLGIPIGNRFCAHLKDQFSILNNAHIQLKNIKLEFGFQMLLSMP